LFLKNILLDKTHNIYYLWVVIMFLTLKMRAGNDARVSNIK